MQMRHECLHTLREDFKNDILLQEHAGWWAMCTQIVLPSYKYYKGKSHLFYKENKGPAVRDIILC